MDKKKTYFLIICICLSFGIIGATYAYFSANAVDNSINGDAATVSFGLKVERVTTVDMAYGLVPMRNNQSPGAASNKCYDDNGNAGCQLYRITATADTDTVMFLDGYVVIKPKEGVETRVARVYTNDEEENFYTKYTPDDFLNVNTLKEEYLLSDNDGDPGIKTGLCIPEEDELVFNHSAAGDCFIVFNEKFGGDAGREKVFYMMIWVYDDGTAQNYLQGMELAYSGEVTFVTAAGNEITATFD